MTRHERFFLSGMLLISVIFGLSRIILRLATPSDGSTGLRLQIWNGQPGIGISSVFVNTHTPLQPKDVVLRVNDRDIVDWASRARDPFWAGEYDLREGTTLVYRIVRNQQIQDISVTLQSYILQRFWDDIFNAISGFVYLGVALYVYWQRPHLAAARALLVLGTGMFCIETFRAYELEITDYLNGMLGWSVVCEQVGGFLVLGAILHFGLVFPTPNRFVQRWHHFVPICYFIYPLYQLFITHVVLSGYFLTNYMALDYEVRVYMAGLSTAFYLIGLSLGLWRAYFSPIQLQRQQLRLVQLGSLISIFASIFLHRMPTLLRFSFSLPNGISPVFDMVFPIAVMIAILRYRLFEINAFINRTLVYTLLTLLIIGAYILIVTGLGGLIDAPQDTRLSLLATSLIALLFQPVRQRAQRAVNYMMYGQRDEPFQLLNEMNQHLVRFHETQDVLNQIVKSIATALKLPAATIFLYLDSSEQDTQPQLMATYPMQLKVNLVQTNLLQLPLVNHDTTIGELWLYTRSAQEKFSSTEQALLRKLLPHISLAVASVRYAHELHKSDERVYNERRRLQRDLHDSLGPALTTLRLNIDIARGLLKSNTTIAPFKTDEITPFRSSTGEVMSVLDDMQQISQIALDEMRQVVQSAHSKVFQQSLGDTLSKQIDRLQRASPNHTFYLDLCDEIRFNRFSSIVEMTAYRIVTEALTNVIKHADATKSIVSLTLLSNVTPKILEIRIEDNGKGLPKNVKNGVGLLSMQARAAECGGTCNILSVVHGTLVHAQLPIIEK